MIQQQQTLKNDGKQLQTLIEKSKAAGMQVKTVIGDTDPMKTKL